MTEYAWAGFDWLLLFGLVVVEMVWPKLSSTRLVGCDEHKLCATP